MKKIEDLIEEYIENYNEYLDSTIDYPDEEVSDYHTFRQSEKEILEYYGLAQEKKIHKPLYSFLEGSCFENKVQCTTEVIDSIIINLEKLKEIKPYVKKMDALFESM